MEPKMQENKTQNDYSKEWCLDRDICLATHSSGLSMCFVNDFNGKINKHYEHLLPWMRDQRKQGLTPEEIYAKKDLLSNQFDEICRKEFCTQEHRVPFNDEKPTKWQRVSNIYNKTINVFRNKDSSNSL